MMPWGLLSTCLLLGAPYPDVLDVLRTRGLRPRMNLLLDSSGSMGNGHRRTNCDWFADRFHGGDLNFNKNEQMRAVLVGCQRPSDGILDKWVGRVEFSIHDFRGLQAGFGSSLETLESAVLGVPVSGGTPLSRTLDRGGEYLDGNSNDGNTDVCQPFFQLLLSDGDPNGGSGDFRQDCQPPIEHRTVSANKPWEGAEYLFDRHPDVLCRLSGDQQVRTYTLGFGRQGDYNPLFLSRIAEEGGGAYFFAREVPDLIRAFDSIMATVAARGQTLAQITVGQETFFTANRAYSVSYQPQISGVWNGNVRRLCLEPPRLPGGAFDTEARDCTFFSDDGSTLKTNPAVRDLWTGLSAQGTTSGGAGALLGARLGAALGPSPPYWERRNIVTWRPGEPGWVPVRPDTWSEADARAHACDRFRLINYLHGYTAEADCALGTPLRVRDWPLADTVHSAPLELSYGPCEGPDGTPNSSTCFVLVASNDGQLHILDGATGEETSSIVPAELWGDDRVARSRLAQLEDQPSPQYTHRYYLDGEMRLAHVDSDQDGFIGPTEFAWVILSLGRGGRAYYALDVSQMSDGRVDDDVRIVPILPSPETVFSGFADTWAAPVITTMMLSGRRHRAAVFVSGHEPLYDVQERSTSEPPHPLAEGSSVGRSSIVDCSGPNGFATYNGYAADGLCSDFFDDACLGTLDRPCYDDTGLPLDLTTFPLTFSNARHQAAALRFRFSDFDLGPGDVLRLEDGRGTLVAEYRGRALDGAWSDWVYAPRATLRLLTDGQDSPSPGFRIEQVEWVLGKAWARLEPSRSRPEDAERHRPSLVVLDLEVLDDAERIAFSGPQGNEGVLLEVRREGCADRGHPCLDQNTAPDLEHLRCPISGAPSPYVEGGDLAALYFGDECGQLFKLHEAGQGRWSVRRLLNLNRGEVRVSKDHRKVFRRLDIVESLCPGREVVGIYFGTGDVQRPLALDALQRPSATDGRDVVGVLWDHPELPSDLTQDDLTDVTDVLRVDPEGIWASGRHGWRFDLGPHERMLRDPLVVDGVAFWKTFQPRDQPTTCEAGTGLDRIYALDSCSAAPLVGASSTQDRIVWSAVTDIGPELLLLAPKERSPVVSHVNVSAPEPAILSRERPRRPSIFFWREVP